MQCFMWHFKLETRVFDNVYNTSKVGSWEGTNFFFSEGLFLKCFGRNYLPIGLHTQQLIHYVHTLIQYVRWEKGHFCIKW